MVKTAKAYETADEITAVEAAQKMGVGLNYLYMLLALKRLPGRKIGRKWLIPKEAVEQRINAGNQR